MIDTLNFRFLETRYDPGKRIVEHTHPEPNLELVFAGGYREHGYTSNLTVGTHTVVIRPPAGTHTIQVFSETTVCLKIEPKRCWLLKDEYGAIFANHRILNSSHLKGVVRHINTLWQAALETKSLAHHLELEASVIGLLAQVIRKRDRKAGRRWIEEVRHAVLTEPFRGWSIQALASLVERHPVHLERTFRQYFKESVGQFVRRVRLERCRDYVWDGHMSLGELAHLAGFSDQSHFTRAYKNAFGVAPSKDRGNSNTMML
jgi:AraC family transcriptional regulator